MPTAWSVPRSRFWPLLAATLCLAFPTLARAAPPEPTAADDAGAETDLDHARAHEAGARFEDAAAAYERFATEQPKHPEAPAALENAYLLRVGLGHADLAAADLDEFQRLYARDQPERAAALFWSRQAQLERNSERREHALAYLQQYRRSGGVDRELVAEAVIAQIDWRRSCDEPLLLDSCVTRQRRRPLSPVSYARIEHRRAKVRAPSPPTVCPSIHGQRTTVHSRDRKLSRTAQARIARILARIGDGSEIVIPADDPERARAFADAWAIALIYRTDAALEQVLTRDPPTDLELTVDEWRKDSGVPEFERLYAEQIRTRERSLAKFDGFIEAGDALVREYQSVAATGSSSARLIADNRIANVHESIADLIELVPVPATVKTLAQYDQHCRALTRKALPLRMRAKAAYVTCARRSVELQVDDEFSRACLDRLAELVPRVYPRTDELLGEPSYHRGDVTSIGVVGPPFVEPE